MPAATHTQDSARSTIFTPPPDPSHTAFLLLGRVAQAAVIATAVLFGTALLAAGPAPTQTGLGAAIATTQPAPAVGLFFRAERNDAVFEAPTIVVDPQTME